MFKLPPSPFAYQHSFLGRGFLSDNPFVIRRPRRADYRPRNWLSEEERILIGKTGPETPAEDLACAYGITLSYVYKLRHRYRKKLDGQEYS